MLTGKGIFFFFSIDAFVAKYAEASPLLRFGENSSTAFDFAGGGGGIPTSNPTEIRKHATDLYGNLLTSPARCPMLGYL